MKIDNIINNILNNGKRTSVRKDKKSRNNVGSTQRNNYTEQEAKQLVINFKKHLEYFGNKLIPKPKIHRNSRGRSFYSLSIREPLYRLLLRKYPKDFSYQYVENYPTGQKYFRRIDIVPGFLTIIKVYFE